MTSESAEPAAAQGGPDGSPRLFGEEGAKLTYGSYLRVPELLAQQVVVSDPPAHDELLFITIHQVYELWFKLLLFELTSARDAMMAGGSPEAVWTVRHLLERARAVEQVLTAQLPVLETMTPQDFLAFRSLLAPASGFQSVQFREIEFLSGLKDARYVDRLRGLTDEERERLRRRLDEPSLWDGFLALLGARGFAVGSDDEVKASLLEMARGQLRHGDLWDISELLLDHDELSAHWRSRHVVMVERQIGTKSGTGGSTGGPYLRSRLEVRYFPLLWELRSWL
ncbi:MAG: tryptophan 2,3-dioxygenase family protein [Frankiaceae bacterium]